MIIPMTHEHINACAEIMASDALWQQYGVNYAGAQGQFTAGLEEVGAVILVATNQMTVSGFVWYYRHGTFRTGAYIRLIGVASGYQGQGVGTALLRAAEMDIVETTHHVFLLASDFNTDAHKFYTRLGYQAVGDLPDFAQEGITERIFWKRLTKKGGA